MDKIYKKYKKSGSFYRKLKTTREKYENALKHLFSESPANVHQELGTEHGATSSLSDENTPKPLNRESSKHNPRFLNKCISIIHYS